MPTRRTLAAVASLALAGGLAAPVAATAATAERGDRSQLLTQTCTVADARPTVVLLDDDSRVPNRALPGGCSINDVIDDERTWRSHGLFVVHVGVVAAKLKHAGVVNGREALRLLITAAKSDVGRVPGYDVIFDGSPGSFDDWAYAGDGGFDLVGEDSMVSRAGEGGGFGTLWYTPQQYADFSMRLQFRDTAPEGQRANSGVQVRFPDLSGPVEGCPTTFNGSETNNLSWIAVNCGHEIQINDAPDGDPRKTGSVYGFADLDSAASRPTEKVWNELEIRVEGQHYTVIRNGVVINEYENLPGVPFPGRPLDPDSSSRGLVGYVGVQAHGAPQDSVEFRNIRVRPLG